MADIWGSGFRQSDNVEDRRDSPDMTPEWRNVPGSLSAVATSFGNSLWGTPQIPEAPDTPLSNALGKKDIQLVPQIDSESPLERGVNTVRDEINAWRKSYAGRQSFADIPPSVTQPAPIAEGLSPNYNRAVAHIESSGGTQYGNGGGIYQFIPGTAKSLGYTQEQIRAMTPEQQDALNTKFTAQNTAPLAKAGVPVNDFTAYVAHQQGGTGAAKLLTANPSASAVSIVGTEAADGNKPFFYNKDGSPKTVGETLSAFRTHVAGATKAAGGDPDRIMTAAAGAPEQPKTIGGRIKAWLTQQSGAVEVPGVKPAGLPAKPGAKTAATEEPIDPSGGTMTPEQQAAKSAAPPGAVSGIVRKGGNVYFQRYGKLFDAHGNLVG